MRAEAFSLIQRGSQDRQEAARQRWRAAGPSPPRSTFSFPAGDGVWLELLSATVRWGER